MSKRQAASIRRLWELVDRVAPRGDAAWDRRPPLRRGRVVSASRAKQLRATVAQLERAVGRPEMPDGAARSVEVLLSPEGVDAFLELAVLGELRHPGQGVPVGASLSWSSYGTLRDCLKILGEEAGIDGMVLPRVYRERLDLAPVASPEQSAALYRRMADMAADRPLDAMLARTLAAVGVILDCAMRSGDVGSRRVEHLDLDAGSLRVVHHRQNATHMPVTEGDVALRPGTVVALRRWLPFRDRLVASLEGSDHGALWVTVRSTTRQVTAGGPWEPYPKGLPLREKGFRLGFESGIERLNDAMAGQWDGEGPWVPLPTQPERLRRAVELERQALAGS